MKLTSWPSKEERPLGDQRMTRQQRSTKKAQMKTQINTQLWDTTKNDPWEFEQVLPWQKVYVVMHLLKAVKAVAIQIESKTDKYQSKSEPQNQTIHQWKRYEEKDKIQAILVEIEWSLPHGLQRRMRDHLETKGWQGDKLNEKGSNEETNEHTTARYNEERSVRVWTGVTI